MDLRKKLFIALLGATLIIPVKSQCMETLAVLGSYLTPKVITACLATGIGLKWLRTPDRTLPKLQQLNPKTISLCAETKQKAETVEDIKKYLNNFDSNQGFIQDGKKKQVFQVDKGIKINNNTTHVCIALDGCMYKIGCSKVGRRNYLGYLMLKSNIIDMPCITFDSVTDTTRGYNFGGQQDLHNLQTIIDGIKAKNKNIKITLLGNCKGATVILNFLKNKAEKNELDDLKSIASVILESPPISLDHTMKKKIHYPLTHYFFRFVFPNYDYQAPTILDAKQFPKNIPILFGLLDNDIDAPIEDALSIVKKLKGSENENVVVFRSPRKDIVHGSLGKDASFQKACKEFQKKFAYANSSTSSEKK